MSEEEARAVTGLYRREQDRLRDQTARAVAVATDQLDNPFDAQEWFETIVPLVEGATRQSAANTEAYLRVSMEAKIGEAVAAATLAPERYSVEALRGKPPEDVYERSLKAWRIAEAAGRSGRAAARHRATQTAATDVQLASRQASHDWMAGTPSVAGYRRVLGPGKNCGLCVVASTQRYHRSDLMPIHSNCGCTVDPIPGDQPIPQVLEKETLNAVKSRLDSDELPYTRQALSRLGFEADDLPEVKIVQHGELGPTLYDKNWKFTDV